MATSDTEICNLALTRLGNKQLISSLADTTTAGILCNLHYARARDAVLRAHPWNFAVYRAELASDATYTSVFEFDYRYALPSGPDPPYCLKLIRTEWDTLAIPTGSAIYGFAGIFGDIASPIPYRLEGRYILANDTSCKIEYIGRVEDVAQFDELFVDALAQRIAAELCPAITDNAAMTKGLWDVYQAKLEEARGTDATEGSPRDVVDSSGFLLSRI